MFLTRPAFTVTLLLPLVVLGCIDRHTTLNPDVSLKFYSVVAAESETTLLLKVEATNETLILQTPPIATEVEVISAKAVDDGENGFVLHLILNSAAAARMSVATATPGGRIAVVIEDKVWSAPMIQAAISDRLQIFGDFNEEQLERWIQ